MSIHKFIKNVANAFQFLGILENWEVLLFMNVKNYYQIPKKIFELNLNSTEITAFMILNDLKRAGQSCNSITQNFANIRILTLAYKLGKGIRQTIRVIKRLIDVGLIEKERTQGNNIYYIKEFDEKAYIRYPKELLNISRFTHKEKLVYCIMYDMQNNYVNYCKSKNIACDGYFKKSEKEFAKLFNVTTYQQVYNILYSLKDKGILSVKRESNGINRYYVIPPANIKTDLEVYLESASNTTVKAVEATEKNIETIETAVDTAVEKTVEAAKKTITTIENTVNTVTDKVVDSIDSIKEKIKTDKAKFDNAITNKDNNAVASVASVSNVAISDFMQYIRQKNKEADEYYQRLNKNNLGLTWK